ncbi:MAG: hypothetical protein Tsb0020_11500 [Haliangiales bacterium]
MEPWLPGQSERSELLPESGSDVLERGPRSPAPLRAGVAILALAISVPVSLLPRSWRRRIDPERRLPLASGTLFSATIGLLGGLLLFGHAYLTGAGPLIALLPPWLFLLLMVANTVDHSLRLLNAVTLSTELGSFPLWLLERLVKLGQLGVTTARARLGHRGRDGLPRARLLRQPPPGAEP